ncbi:hypothetical protein [Phormidium sp. CCY1219]|uniref:hypothetical protein n=1 Tax=Phormidium sp. CCY1219 TaxID=2886104 RepID=UPI002D79FACE|nr:hypothetical protein [Phormidium sp. CCY1219]
MSVETRQGAKMRELCIDLPEPTSTATELNAPHPATLPQPPHAELLLRRLDFITQILLPLPHWQQSRCACFGKLSHNRQRCDRHHPTHLRRA